LVEEGDRVRESQLLVKLQDSEQTLAVERANRLRERGMPRDEALALASRQRLRPIARPL